MKISFVVGSSVRTRTFLRRIFLTTWFSNTSNMALKVQFFLAYLDGRIKEPSFSTTGGDCRLGLNWDPMMNGSVLSPFNFNLFNDIQEELPINRLECERPLRTNSMTKNRKKYKSGNHLHINETPFSSGEVYNRQRSGPKTDPCGTPKATSVEEEIEPLMHTYCNRFSR